MDDLERIRIAAQETRKKILGILSKDSKITNTEFFSKQLKVKYKSCVFHLKTLERAGLIEGKFTLDNNIATKCYHITEKGKQIFSRIEDLK